MLTIVPFFICIRSYICHAKPSSEFFSLFAKEIHYCGSFPSIKYSVHRNFLSTVLSTYFCSNEPVFGGYKIKTHSVNT